MDDTDRHNFDMLGKAYRSHMENQGKILAAAEEALGHPLGELETHQAAMNYFAQKPDWEIGAAVIASLRTGQPVFAGVVQIH